MKSLTLRQLRYVEALAHHGHFGRAAAACAVSQPALSTQIRDLEQALGCALFERGPRQVQPTALGQEFARRASAILRAADDLGDLARAHQGGVLGRLRLGVIPTIAPYLLPRLVRLLMAQDPATQLQLRETITPRLIEELHAGALDAAIVALPVSEPGLTEMALFREEMVLVRPQAQADQPVPAPESLQGAPLLLLEEGHCFRDQALAVCGMQAGAQREGLDASSLSTLVQMVAAGLGVTLIPEMATEVEARRARVSLARFGGQAPVRNVGMIWRASTPLAAQLRLLGPLVYRAARDTGPQIETCDSRAARETSARPAL